MAPSYPAPEQSGERKLPVLVFIAIFVGLGFALASIMAVVGVVIPWAILINSNFQQEIGAGIAGLILSLIVAGLSIIPCFMIKHRHTRLAMFIGYWIGIGPMLLINLFMALFFFTDGLGFLPTT